MQGQPAPIAPNIAAFHLERERLALGLLHIQAANLAGMMAGLLSIAIGLIALNEASGGDVRALRWGVFVLALGSAAMQVVALGTGLEGIHRLTPRSRAFFPEEDRAAARATLWFLVAFLAIFCGGAVGAVFAGPALWSRSSGGPTYGEVTVTENLILSALAWSSGGFLFNVFVARGIQTLLAPHLPPELGRRWDTYYLAVFGASAISLGLCMWGMVGLGGSNPAGLAGAASAYSLFLLLRIVGAARKHLRHRDEPAALWPPVVSVPVVVPLPGPASKEGPALFAVIPAFVQGPAFPYPTPPAQCPRCQSAQLSFAQLPARGFLCGQCGLGAPY
jgi:hypothetical protein